jgi:sugar/nucleoside kinase (ribokinase family)
VRPIAVIGNVACDLVDGGSPRVGGGPFYAAKALRILGRPARILTRCSLADRDALLPDLIALGIPVTWREAETTSTFGIRYDGHRRFMQVEAVGHRWTPADVRDPVLRDVAAVHVAPLLRSDFPPETLAELARGRRLSLDGQGLVRPGRTGELQLDSDFDPDVLRHLSILKLAEEEAEAVLGNVGGRAVAGLGVPEVLVTFGPRGSVVHLGGEETFVPANEVTSNASRNAACGRASFGESALGTPSTGDSRSVGPCGGGESSTLRNRSRSFQRASPFMASVRQK